MKILVLGGNGYLGSRVVHALVQEGHFVVCTRRASSNLNRLQDLLEGESSGQLQFIPASEDGVEAALQDTAFEAVCNMACHYGGRNSSGEDILDANLQFPLKVLVKAAEAGVGKFLTMGTGLPDELNLYSFSKRMLGEFGSFYAKQYGIHFYHLKLEMFYGSDEPAERFLPGLIRNMLQGRRVDVTLGTQHRDIISAEDVVRAVIQCLHAGGNGYQEISVGTGIAPAVREIVEFIHRKTGEKSQIHFGAIPMRPGEPDCVADTTAITALFEHNGGWHPVFWQDGIARMIEDIGTKEKRKNEAFD